jgi:hypothetical protein
MSSIRDLLKIHLFFFSTALLSKQLHFNYFKIEFNTHCALPVFLKMDLVLVIQQEQEQCLHV